MAVSNPFTAQLQQFNASIPNARQGLVDIYKLRRRGREQTYNTLNKLYGGEYNQLSGLIGSNAAAFGDIARQSEAGTIDLGYDLTGSQNQLPSLRAKVSSGSAPFQGLSQGTLQADLGREQGFRRAALGEQKQLKGALPRERSAALSELESGIVDVQSNLYLDRQAFDQQQAYNQSLQRFYDTSVANFAYSSGQAVGGSLVEQAARRYLGIPYKWGGTSASGGFDCSGLTRQVYRDLGIDLPRTAAQQQQSTPFVGGGLRNAQPGDLLFWGSPAHHVAIYVGNGMMIAAPHAGARVQVQAVYGNPEVHRVQKMSANTSNRLVAGRM